MSTILQDLKIQRTGTHFNLKVINIWGLGCLVVFLILLELLQQLFDIRRDPERGDGNEFMSLAAFRLLRPCLAHGGVELVAVTASLRGVGPRHPCAKFRPEGRPALVLLSPQIALFIEYRFAKAVLNELFQKLVVETQT